MNIIKKTDSPEMVAAKIKGGDQSAFKDFFNLYNKSIFNFLYRYTFDYDLSNDLVQETFIKFWQSRERLDPENFPKAYIFKIARNLALNAIQRQFPSVSLEEESNYLVDLYQSPQRELDWKFLLNDFQKAIIQLPERCRTIFILSRYHDMSYEEIANVMGISIQTVKNQMNKSLSILRKALSKHID